MAKVSIQSCLIGLVFTSAASQALAGPASHSAPQELRGQEIWDRVEVSAQAEAAYVSHIDIQPGQSFDEVASAQRAVPAALKRSDIRGSIHFSEAWDQMDMITRPASTPIAASVSHIDIQPGQSFDGPAMTPQAPHSVEIVRTVSADVSRRSGA